MRRGLIAILGFVAVAALAGCGVPPENGADVGGTVGVSVTGDGIQPAAGINVRQGPLSLHWGMS